MKSTFEVGENLERGMISKIRVHTCGNQRYEGYITEKCRCRKYVTQEKAEQLKNDGYAAHVITSIKTIDVEDICSMCEGNDRLKKSCKACGKTGIETKKRNLIEYGEDIYMRPILRTPRTATIEKNHLEYAYVKLDKDAARRIELYHESDQSALGDLGAEIRNPVTGEVVRKGTPEPKNDPAKGQGRDHDYGRAI